MMICRLSTAAELIAPTESSAISLGHLRIMRFLTLGLVLATVLVVASADYPGWDDLSCSGLFKKLTDLKIIDKRLVIKDAFCNHDIDGESLEQLQNAECSKIHGLDPGSCESMRKYFAEIAARPSSKFKDVWDWRAHHKRLFDHWLLPLTQ
jgi:hypothetical protein